MKLVSRARDLAASGQPVAVLRVARVRGSAPREEGAVMLVTRDGILGSIGGGTLEWKALAQAQRLLEKGPSQHAAQYALGPDLGQCCGGQVEILTEVYDQSNCHLMGNDTKAIGRQLFLFGAGHVGKSLVLVLAQTEFDVVWCDPRPGAFPSHVPGNVRTCNEQDVPGVLTGAQAGSLVLVMTHSHALDFAIVDASLRNPAVAVTGLIGSATKRARFESRLTAAGVPPERVTALICPIGVGGIRSKRPEAIAISTAAQLLALDESLNLAEGCPAMSIVSERLAASA